MFKNIMNKYRLLALILLMSVFGINISYAQSTVVTRYDANSADGGRWQMPYISNNFEYYDGFSDLYYRNFSSPSIDLSTISNMFGRSLFNVNNYILVGWNINNVIYGINDVAVLKIDVPTTIFTFTAVWSQQQQPPQPPQPTEKVALKWKVSVNSASPFIDVPDGGTTAVFSGNSIYLQTYIETENIDYDSWEIMYNVTNDEYFYAMPLTDKGSSFLFNNSNPYSKTGKTTYTVRRINFYKTAQGGRQPSVVYQYNCSYQYTLQVDEIIEPKLQWAASINTNGNFIDYDKNTSLNIGENDSIYLLIRPSGGNIEYNGWSFDYTANPGSFHREISRISGTGPYRFNSAKAFNDFENIEFNVTNMRLYSNNQEIRNIQFAEPYIFTIEKESSEIKGIDVLSPDLVCTVTDKFSIPFNILYKDNPIQYSISFSDEAKKAGFKDITSFSDLPKDNYFIINIPQGVPSGLYSGNINLKCDKEEKFKKEYPFSFEIINNGVSISRQPVANQSLCGGSSVALTAEITGNARSYQWYRNNEAITGAKSRSYVASTPGDYFLEIMGECDIVRSETVSVAAPGTDIKVKWGDVLYIENSANKYQRFQWYHNNESISGATFVYYTDKDGFIGEYSVRCYLADGSYDETCPIIFDARTKSNAVSIYPTVLKAYESFNINILNSETDAEALVEIYSITGVLAYSTKIYSAETTVTPNINTKGIYVVKVKLPSGKMLNEKIIIQ